MYLWNLREELRVKWPEFQCIVAYRLHQRPTGVADDRQHPDNGLTRDTLAAMSTLVAGMPRWCAATPSKHDLDCLFRDPIANDEAGHIDFSQVRNGAARILDYKPNIVNCFRAHCSHVGSMLAITPCTFQSAKTSADVPRIL